MTPLAAAFYETDWFRALLYILVAVIAARVVDSILARRDRAMPAADISGGGVLLRLHAWATDPLRRRELASDLRAAVLRRLAGDGLIGAGEPGGGD